MNAKEDDHVLRAPAKLGRCRGTNPSAFLSGGPHRVSDAPRTAPRAKQGNHAPTRTMGLITPTYGETWAWS
eukprot:scaffold56_cov379-Prasinococcus_capsulatus_cf.AAC.3